MFALFKRVRAAYNRRRREIDCLTLWPEIRAYAITQTQARNAFLKHCISDPAWQDLSFPEIIKTIIELPWRD